MPYVGIYTTPSIERQPKNMQLGCALRLKESFKPPLADQTLYGQLEERPSPDKLKVNLMMRDGAHLKLGSLNMLVDVHSVDVEEHQNITKLHSISSHRRAWKALGLRLTKVSDDSEDVFMVIKNRQVVDDEYDSESEDEQELVLQEQRAREKPGLQGYDSDGGFVVNDDEPFTLADAEESEFVAETHEAVNQYNEWVPKTDAEKKVRKWMDDFERKIAHKDDEAQFAAGSSCNYTCPPRRNKRQKT